MHPWLSRTYEMLAQRIAVGRLHHALLIKGNEGLGIDSLAQGVAGRLLCQQPAGAAQCGVCQACNLIKADSHPDFHVIESDKQIGVDAIRTAIGKLSGTAQLSGAKVLILHNAHTMTEAAANALLKTLEEPTDNTYLMLLCNRSDQMLPTILSRCEKTTVPPPSPHLCRQWLQEQGHQQADEALMARYQYAPLLIKQALEESSVLSFAQFDTGLSELRQGQISPAGLAEKWESQTLEVLEWLAFSTANKLRQMPLGQQQHKLLNLYQQCATSRKTLDNPGVNKALILANLLAHAEKFESLTHREVAVVS